MNTQQFAGILSALAGVAGIIAQSGLFGFNQSVSTILVAAAAGLAGAAHVLIPQS